jgi:transcriptional regulator with XRE-family HTH domain
MNKTKTVFDQRYKALVAEMVRLRKNKGLSQAELARASNMSKTTIGRIETRDRRLDYIDTVDILKAIGLSKSEILTFLEKFI